MALVRKPSRIYLSSGTDPNKKVPHEISLGDLAQAAVIKVEGQQVNGFRRHSEREVREGGRE